MNKNLIEQSGNSIRAILRAARGRKARVRSQQALNDAITMETLETRQLMTVISVTDFGANANGSGDDTAAIQSALNAAKPGDTVSFPAGTYQVNNVLNVPTGVTITGVSSGASHLKFNLPGGDYTSYGFVLNGNDSNVTIENLDIVSNHGILSMGTGSEYNNIVITNNRMQYGGGQSSNGTLVYGMSCTVTNNGTKVTNNYFHDSPNTARNWCFWFSENSNFDHNTFYNINDGGALDDMGANVSFSYNYGTNMHRMGQEIAGDSSTSNLKVDGNVFYNYVNPYYDTEGVSVVMFINNAQIENNYFDANIAPGSGWGQPDGGGAHRFGYAIEATGTPGTVSGNTIIGTWAEIVSAMTTNVTVTNNKVYGVGLWGDFDGEPGPYGNGSANASNNLIDTNSGDAPAAPANTNSYLGVSGSNSTTSGSSGVTTTPPPVTTPPPAAVTTPAPTTGITGVTGTAASDTSVNLTWANTGVTLSSAVVQIITTQGRVSYPSVTFNSNATSATISGLHAGWQYDFTIVGTTTGGATVTSTPVTVQTTGDSNAGSVSTGTGSTSSGTGSTTGGTGSTTGGTGSTTGGTGSTTGSTGSTTGSTGSTTASTGSTTGSTGSTTGSTGSTTGSTGSTTGSTGSTTGSTGSTTGTTTGGTSGTTTGSTTTTTATTDGLTGLAGTVVSDNSVALSWNNTGVTLSSATIQIVTTQGRVSYPALLVNGNVEAATIGQLHAGWQYDFTVVGTTSTGQTVTSGPITLQTSGDSAPSYSLAPVALSSTLILAPAAPTTVAAITGVTGSALSDTSVQLAWTSPSTDVASVQIQIITTQGRVSFPSVSATGNQDTATITGLHAGWQFDFTIVETSSDGTVSTSDPITVMTTGNSLDNSMAATTAGVFSLV